MDNLIADDLKVLVFRSTINNTQKTDQVRQILLKNPHIYQVHIDLEDIDNVLRIECHPDCPSTRIQEQVTQLGFNCTSLL